MIEVGEIENAQSFALHNTEPLLNLVHPGTVDREKEANEARMRLKPGLNLLAMMDTRIIENKGDVTDGRWDLPV